MDWQVSLIHSTRSIGLEDVDDAIERDLHRTFPEHPYFSATTGRQALFNVLKAYSVHDFEVRGMS